MNNQIWVMSSAFPGKDIPFVIQKTKDIGAQGIEACVFRQGGTRSDHIATTIEYEGFGPDQAKEVIDQVNAAQLRLSIGAYENLIGGEQKVANQNHLLSLVRMAALMGGDANDVKVGTFVGYNHELGIQDAGFQKNLDEFAKVFKPIIKFAEDNGVTIIYENCPMEGWRPASTPTTYNNLPATLAARKLMYTLIPSSAHGETYDPSHDVWQGTDPVKVIEASDMDRIHRVHIKATRNLDVPARTYWGSLYPMQAVDKELAEKAGVPTCQHEWDRHHYEPMMPGFGGSDSMDWRAFIEKLKQRGFEGPYVMENEAANSKQTGNIGAIVQGFQAGILCLAPMIWGLWDGQGYQFDTAGYQAMKAPTGKDIKPVTMDMLV
jgi:sugar phosphate isomerase/epimerase